MSCIMMMNRLIFLKVCRKYGRQFISIMNISMHEDQNMITMQLLVYAGKLATDLWLTNNNNNNNV